MPRKRNILSIGRPRPEIDPSITVADVLDEASIGAEWRWGEDESLVLMWRVLGDQVEIGALGSFQNFTTTVVMLSAAADGILRQFRCPQCLRRTPELYVMKTNAATVCLVCHMSRAKRRRGMRDFLPVRSVIAAVGPPAQFLTHSTLTAPKWKPKTR